MVELLVDSLGAAEDFRDDLLGREKKMQVASTIVARA